MCPKLAPSGSRLGAGCQAADALYSSVGRWPSQSYLFNSCSQHSTSAAAAQGKTNGLTEPTAAADGPQSSSLA